MLQSLKALFERTPAPAPVAKKSQAVDSASVAPPRLAQSVLQPEVVPQDGPEHAGYPVPMYPRLGPAVPGVPPTKLVATQDKLIRELRQASSLSYGEFDKYMLPSIVLFAEYVHLLPASEYDHHSDLGGLFRHGLEVALNASRRAEGKEFALNEVPSVRKFQIARWRACALLGGMLHDMGKAVIDVGAKTVAGDKVWNPHVQPLWRWIDEHNVEQYMIRWRETRRHKEHDAISATVLVRIIPESTMRWLGEYGGRAAYDAMLMALTGSSDRSNPLVEIIKKADQDSVSADRADAQRRLASVGEAGSRSDAAVLVRAMRDLILKGEWQVNTLGHIVWHTERGLYVMYPQCAKEAVEHLRGQGASTTLPNDPPVILDVLRNAGIVVQNSLPNGKAYDLHRIKIYTKDRDGSELALDMTALKFANDRIIPDYFALPGGVHVDICDPDGKVIETSRQSPPQSTEPNPDAAEAEISASASVPSTAAPMAEAPAADVTASPPAPASQGSSAAPSGSALKKSKKKKARVNHLASLDDPEGEDQSDSDSGLLVFEDTDQEFLHDETPIFVQSTEDTPLRDRAAERDARVAVIEDNRAIAEDPFPPTSTEGARLWLKRQSKKMYLQYVIDRVTRGELKYGIHFRKVDEHLHFLWPDCMEGNGVDPPVMLDTLHEEDWIMVDARGRKTVGGIKNPTSPNEFSSEIRFNHGVSRALEMLLPEGATQAPVPDAGPYITGRRSRIFHSVEPRTPLWQAIFQSALYVRLVELYGDTEGGIAGQPPKRLFQDLSNFYESHLPAGTGRLGQINRLEYLKEGDNPLALPSEHGQLIINPDYQQHTDDLAVERALAK